MLMQEQDVSMSKDVSLSLWAGSAQFEQMATKGYGPESQSDLASSIMKHTMNPRPRLPQIKPSQEIIDAIAACAPTTTANSIDTVAPSKERTHA